jgi:Domain of Unknown Function (DUF928)
MGRIILGLLASLLVVCSLPANAIAQGSAMDLLLRPDHPPSGTMKKYPSICWILKTRPSVGATMMFTLMDFRSIKPVLEVQVPHSIQTDKNETCDCVNLKDYDIPLEPDIQYRWHISIARNPESHSRAVVVGGVIEGCSELSCLIGETSSRCDRNFVRVLAIRGFWYDSISCLCDLIKSSPDDENLRRMLAALMRQAGLERNPN